MVNSKRFHGIGEICHGIRAVVPNIAQTWIGIENLDVLRVSIGHIVLTMRARAETYWKADSWIVRQCTQSNGEVHAQLAMTYECCQ